MLISGCKITNINGEYGYNNQSNCGETIESPKTQKDLMNLYPSGLLIGHFYVS